MNPRTPTRKSAQIVEQEKPLLTGHVRHSIFGKMAVPLVGITAGAIVLLGSTAFVIAGSVLSSRILDQVAVMASVREDYLEKALQNEREQAALVATRPEFRALLQTEEAGSQVVQLLADLRRQNASVLGMTLFSQLGTVISSAGERSAALPPGTAGSMSVPLVDGKKGWIANDVYVSLSGVDGRRVGIVALRYDANAIVAALFSSASLGRDAEVTLGSEHNGEIVVVQHSRPDPLRSYVLGSADATFLFGTPIVRAVEGEEHTVRTRNDRGRDVFAAYRYLPSLGWGMSVEVPAATALYGLSVLGFSIAGIGLFLLVLASLLAFVFARRITGPLLQLSQKMRALKPGKWTFRRTVYSGDEVEVLDGAFAKLTQRLRLVYSKLEDTVTDRTNQLRKESALDHAILETIEYGVVVVDPAGIITDMNPAGLALLGWHRDEVIGKRGTEILSYAQSRKTFGKENHPLSVVLKGNQNFRSHAASHPSLLRKNQTLLPVTFLVTPLLQDKKMFGAIAVFQDMTEERQIDYMKSEFITLASHQLRTPLSSIRWYVELLESEEKKEFNAAQKSYFAEIQKAVQRMANLLEALLHVAKLEGGGMVPTLHNTDLRDLAEQAAEEWTPTMKEKGVSFTVVLPPPASIVRTDPVLLEIIVQNFINNAMKYTPKGKEIMLSVRREREKFIISVRDTGIGIPTGEQKRVFEKFFRAHNVRQMDTDGTGLGLYMSKAIAEKLGGAIFFESQEGKGSTFTLVLPGRKGGN